MSLRFLSIFLLVLPGWVLADTTLTYSNVNLPGGQTIIQVKDGNVLMGDQRANMLFKEGNNELVVIDHESKSYMVMDEETAKKLEQQMGAAREQMNAMMQQMQQQMKNMSAEERAQLEKMLGDRMPMGTAQKPVETTVRHQGEDTVAGVTCTKMMVLVNDKPSGDVCVATAGVLGIDTNDYNSMVSATDAVRNFVERVSGRNDNDAVTMNLRAMKGIPIRMRDLVDGDISTLESRSSAELDAQLFTIPSGYRKRDMLR